MGHAQGQGSWASSVPVRDGPLPATAGLSGSQGFWSGVVAVAFTKRDSSPGVVGPSLQESDRRGPPLPCPPQSPGPTCRRGRCLCRWRWALRRAVSSPPVPCWACCAGGGRGARGELGGLSPGAGRHPPQRLLGPLPRPSPPAGGQRRIDSPERGRCTACGEHLSLHPPPGRCGGQRGPALWSPRQPVVSGCLRDRAASLCQLFCFLRCRQASVTQLRASPRSPPLSPRGPSQLASSSPSFSLTTSGPRQARPVSSFPPSSLPLPPC